MSVVCKMFIQSATENPDGSKFYNLGAVCRGEENKHWAAATPSGSAKVHDDESGLIAMLWREPGASEVELEIAPHDEGGWIFDKCDFSYGGCQVHFRQKDQPWGELSLTINATGATKVLRQAYADACLSGNPAKFTVTFRHP